MAEKLVPGESAGDFIVAGCVVAALSLPAFLVSCTVGWVVLAAALLITLVGVIAKGVEVGMLAADRERRDLGQD